MTPKKNKKKTHIIKNKTDEVKLPKAKMKGIPEEFDIAGFFYFNLTGSNNKKDVRLIVCLQADRTSFSDYMFLDLYSLDTEMAVVKHTIDKVHGVTFVKFLVMLNVFFFCFFFVFFFVNCDFFF